MQKKNGKILYSATDLANFAECQHLSWLDRLNLDEPMPKVEDDEQAKLIQEKGFAHEAAYLESLKSGQTRCVEIDASLALQERVDATRAAIDSGADVLYQGTLARENLIGHSDFLFKVETTTGLAYEVVDTKLSHHAKAKHIIQLCFYSDLLSDVTGKLPAHMHVELGNGKRETFRVGDFFYYYRHLLARFLAFVEQTDGDSVSYPAPCDFCSLCHWRERCASKREEDDHLSAVANITRQQVSRLEAAGVRTLAQLGQLAPSARIPRLRDETLQKLREQAALQLEERETGEQKTVVLPVEDGGIRGFARLPRPDSGDLFFDMEGDPMQEGGLEYLFGAYYLDGDIPRFKCFWAHSREDERQAFCDFMDFVMARLQQFPDMHVYHYANYENHALKKLMTLHGVRERDVDQLLREGRLVDLYKVVREGLRISKPSYSIKEVESFYAEKRSAEVKKATDSIVAYEHWMVTGDPEILESIRMYNEDDCRSTWQLREWLLTLRPAHLAWFNTAAAGEEKKPERQKSDKTIELENQLADFHRRLVTHPEYKAIDPELAMLVDQLLDFHRRAEKPAWWALFDRREAELEDLLDDSEVIAGLHNPEYVGEGSRYPIFRYRYPEQDFKVKEGDRARRLDNLREVIIAQIDEDACTVDLEMNLKGEESEPQQLSISIGAPLETSGLRKALFRFAEGLIRGDGRNKAILDYLARKIPDIGGIEPGAPIVSQDGDPLPQTLGAAANMQDSYLFIQGPPGAGKTYTGSHLIASLLQAGKRVAVSSNSHKAINNLLSAVDRRMEEAGASYIGMKKCSSAEHAIKSDFIENVSTDTEMIRSLPKLQLAAGTVFLLAKAEFDGQFDYLFVDEAGQVSLANLVAMAQCARNLILLGDQMQLSQPVQGTHPGRSGESSLDYLLNGEQTIAPEHGVFLEKTYRMHPNVCRFISEAFYDSRLHSDETTFGQKLILTGNAHPVLKPTGIRYLPVDHDGCSQRSEKEAVVVREIVENLLVQQYCDKAGTVHPITLNDILIVAPYNMQVNLLRRTLPIGARVGTVDKFQGQEAEVVIVSMATSSQEFLPRNIEFLFSKNRLNVALSRARCLATLICSRKLLINDTGLNIRELSLINTLSHLYDTYKPNANY